MRAFRQGNGMVNRKAAATHRDWPMFLFAFGCRLT
jgi:hypothetical protein